jgi:hypothetical protein
MKAEVPSASFLEKITEIAADGDIILVVGHDGVKLRVHSLILKTASKVFSAMLGPYFSEGQNITKDCPKEILLPEDDADALKIICEITHLQNSAVPDSLPPSAVIQLAITADKYDCVPALKFASAHWLEPRESQAVADLALLMAAAYILDDAQGFMEVSRSMIIQHDGSYLLLANEELELIVPWRIFCG